MASPESTPALRPPRQERSRRTLERILASTERLLRTQAFEEIGIQQIVKAAGTSVGAFYARFEDKAALLGALYERYSEGLDGHIERWRAAQPQPSPDLRGASAWVARYLIESFRERRNLLRALALHVRQRPGATDGRTSARRIEQHAFLEQALLEHRDEIRDAEPQRAVRTAIFLGASACRERIFFGETPHARALEQDDARLAADVTRLIAGYLLCPVSEEDTP